MGAHEESRRDLEFMHGDIYHTILKINNILVESTTFNKL